MEYDQTYVSQNPHWRIHILTDSHLFNELRALLILIHVTQSTLSV